MKPTLPRRSLSLAALVVAVLAAAPVAARPFHFGLARSVPAEGATVHELTEVRLWFTEPPAEGTVSIRLIDAGGKPLETSAPAADEEDAKVFSIAVPEGVEPGEYRVAWRGMGADGHVVRGEFSFTLAGH